MNVYGPYIHTYIHTNIHTALCRLITREVKPNCRNHCRMHSSCMEHNDEDTKMLQGVWSGATTVGCTADAWNIMMKIQKFVRCIVQKVAIFNIEQWVMPYVTHTNNYSYAQQIPDVNQM